MYSSSLSLAHLSSSKSLHTLRRVCPRKSFMHTPRRHALPFFGAPDVKDISLTPEVQHEISYTPGVENNKFELSSLLKTSPSIYIEELSYTAFLRKIASNDIVAVSVNYQPRVAQVTDKKGDLYFVRLPNSFVLEDIIKKGVEVYILPEKQATQNVFEAGMNALGLFFQVMFIGFLLQMILASRQSASQMLNNLSNSSQEYDATMPKITFEDVAGLEGVKNELVEIVDFLKNPTKFSSMGAVLPKGVLLTGPPGTGKTLLAKAVAGEAGVPFIFCSGSEFVQVFVGVGASRVRELFKKAREKAPCIIFIDEIDAIGRERSMNNATGANTEQEQTMNQILTEMDGFKGSEGIVIIAATNRKEILDEALIRSGRFDRHVQIPMPSRSERKEILETHMRDKKIAENVNIEELATLTQGMVGADLKNLVNEAIIYSVRKDHEQVTREAFVKSLDKMILGIENKSVQMSESDRRLVAYHEAGHALLGILVSDYDLLSKVTIVPRANAGGLTVFQEKDQDLQLYSQNYLLNRMIVALGGHVAEEHIFGHLHTTTGAVSDLQNVQNVARRMVTSFGFNETLGKAAWDEDVPIAGSTSDAIDSEVKLLVDLAYRSAQELIEKYETYLHRIAEKLLEKNTIYNTDILEAIEGLICNIEDHEREESELEADSDNDNDNNVVESIVIEESGSV